MGITLIDIAMTQEAFIPDNTTQQLNEGSVLNLWNE
jgi:hypothetical protein